MTTLFLSLWGAMGPILNGVGNIFMRVRPNILLGMILITVLGMGISWIGYKMGMEGIISAAGVGSIVAISNLAGKILETEKGGE